MTQDIPSPDSKGNEVRARMEGWRKQSEERLNEATIKSGVIPALHEVFKERGLTEGYFIVDAIEITRGFPVNAYTRYVLPVLTDEGSHLDPDISDIHPGIVINNIVSMSVRSLAIQIGLDNEDLAKIGVAINSFYKKNNEDDNLLVVHPPWWNYDFADYITYLTPADYEQDDTFWWGKYIRHPQIFDLMYEQETRQKSEIENLWGVHQQQLRHAFEEQSVIIDKVLVKTS